MIGPVALGAVPRTGDQLTMQVPRPPSRGRLRELLRELLEDSRRVLRVMWLAWRLLRELSL